MKKWLVLVVGMFAMGCSGSQTPAVNQAVTVAIKSADAAYALSVEACDAHERWIVERSGTSAEQDEADMEKVRDACDAIFETFNDIRDNQAKLRHAAGVLEELRK